MENLKKQPLLSYERTLIEEGARRERDGPFQQDDARKTDVDSLLEELERVDYSTF